MVALAFLSRPYSPGEIEGALKHMRLTKINTTKTPSCFVLSKVLDYSNVVGSEVSDLCLQVLNNGMGLILLLLVIFL